MEGDNIIAGKSA